MTNNKKDEQQGQPRMRRRDMISTVLFGALGVQSNKARERDFTHGKPSHFIYFGIGFMLVFVLVLVGIVKLVTHLAG
ncbi:hypothetical protein BN1049_02848 [Pseudomonas saudimassiliensis]|uniref:DUF2970 domain-containing protein n=1 Tax=Pseudomonas saudimassiliensis TaxID=1461581 RepID=A0A078MJK1_9PSED|nr:DUF2970 domain-containing protein [Pseudomonas saudimassiliensis]CEA06460.1 hypothetical protein BN1049_02848 [Pseudomonas saudimassiliensis]CEF27885.1 hypothetical protein BN1049_02848 [Pseudomonas saudimassiliensis]